MPNLDEPARELLRPLESPPEEGTSHPALLKGPVLFKGEEMEILGKVDGKSRQEIIPVPKQGDSATSTHENENGTLKTANGGADTVPGVDAEKEKLANGDASAPQQETTA